VVKDDQSPKRIDRFLAEVENFEAAQQLGENGKKFKIDLQRLLYSLLWLHNATLPEFHLQLGARSGGLVRLYHNLAARRAELPRPNSQHRSGRTPFGTWR
jgi:hypothetical protein